MFKLIKRGFDKNFITSYGNMFLIGNGHLGYKGTLEEYRKEEMVSLNVAGLYDRYKNKWRESINLPNPFYVKVFDDLKTYDVYNNPLDHKIELDLKHAIFKRKTTFKELSITSERFISRREDNFLVLKYVIRSNTNNNLKMVLGLDSLMYEINGPHFKEKDIKIVDNNIFFNGLTNENKNVYTQSIYEFDHCEKKEYIFDNINGYLLNLSLKKGDYFKVVIYSKVSEGKKINYKLNKSYSKYKKEHALAFEKMWDIADIKIGGNRTADFNMRYSIYQLLILENSNYNHSIAARGISGSVYKGAIFWDTEIFLLPFYLNTNPKFARKLVEYRINTLGGALKKANKYGFDGAFYAWESQEKGQDACSKYNVTNPKTGKPIRTYFDSIQIHISADISYALKRYVDYTKDTSILFDGGFKMALEIAKFYYSRSTFINNRYELNDVIGPDEYHEHVNNNAFTNYMAYFSVKYALDLMKEYKEFFDEELYIKLYDYLNKLYLPKPNKNGLIEQFDGYFNLEDVTVDEVKKRVKHPKEYLGGKYGVASSTRVIKQADVITLLALYPNLFSEDVVKANYDYYFKYTEHGSSLSSSMYSLVASQIGYTDYAYQMFLKSASIDLGLNQKVWAGGVYIGGTHPASNGGAYLSLIYGMCGLQKENCCFSLKPKLPNNIKSVEFNLIDNGAIKKIIVNKDGVELADMKKGIIFDLDGVLVYTDKYHYLAWKKIADKENIYFDEKINNRLRGVSRMDSLDIVLERSEKTYSKEEKEELAYQKNEIYKDYLKDMNPSSVSSETRKTIEHLKSMGLKLAIASSSKNTKFILEQTDLLKYFDAVVDGNDITNSKPNPEVFLKASLKLALDPKDCFVVEDAYAGIDAAYNGLFESIGIGDASKYEKATYKIKNIQEITKYL